MLKLKPEPYRAAAFALALVATCLVLVGLDGLAGAQYAGASVATTRPVAATLATGAAAALRS